ncbi:hypothetical protein BJ998_004388 [Kutzneria kofuensis]|uniref:Uncharacterized protein n=1 Tax=Kutzneria kofuensis TaxID=103725 RepID=A0A7W9KIF2_9PSEU|nr:hypothetical protein [Kutzneria kofuensis]
MRVIALREVDGMARSRPLPNRSLPQSASILLACPSGEDFPNAGSLRHLRW